MKLKPSTVHVWRTSGFWLSIPSSFDVDLCVLSIELPGGVFKAYNTKLWSSVGINPVGALRASIKAAIVIITSMPIDTHLWRIKKPRLLIYRCVICWQAGGEGP